MVETYRIADRALEEALRKSQVGTFSRKVFFNMDDSPRQFGFEPEPRGGVRYSIDNRLVVEGRAELGHKLRNFKHEGVVSLKDFGHYMRACSKIEAAHEIQKAQAEAEYQEALAAWKEKFPNYDPDKKLRPKKLGRITFSRAALERPRKKSVDFLQRYCGLKPQHGILIPDYRDKKNCREMRLESLTVKYVHKDAEIQFGWNTLQHLGVTDAEFRQIYEGIKNEFSIDLISAGYTTRRPGEFERDAGVKIFAKEVRDLEHFKQDEFAEVVRNVFAAGEKFRQGVASLESQVRQEQEEERARKEKEGAARLSHFAL